MTKIRMNWAVEKTRREFKGMQLEDGGGNMRKEVSKMAPNMRFT